MHSSCLRFPADVPSAGRRVVLCLQVRGFFCPDDSRGRLTIVEHMSGLTRGTAGGPSSCGRRLPRSVSPSLAEPAPGGEGFRGVRQPQRGVAVARRVA
ncbi:hypothetical protein [Streptomyces luteogriseus]|uniref:hypothetical protein n=1 Tax=Streptomyces luteogriseus TaxID=68233 RepID=UPI0027D7960D|nr:hypothetical protein [Streptomyces luteogriseus]